MLKKEIGLGFHTCVDYELVWDTEKVKEKIHSLGIQRVNVQMRTEAEDEKQLWGGILYYLEQGIGGEIIPAAEELCQKMGEEFAHRVTLGGTATRAAIALSQMGIPSILQTSCYNRYVEELLPENVEICSDIRKKEENIYPHIVLQCEAGVKIQEGDIRFTTPRENRILISSDPTSLRMDIRPEAFGKNLEAMKVFLVGSFSQILEEPCLEEALAKTNRLLEGLPEDTMVIMEDGCYVKKAFRRRVHQVLSHRIDVLSMNEDELAEYVGKKIDVFDDEQVAEAIKAACRETGVETMVIHSSAWALAVGRKAAELREGLVCGVGVAGTRFCVGDALTKEAFEKTLQMEDKKESRVFLEKLKARLGGGVEGVASKDFSHVKTPTVVGLGDAFAGGLLYGIWKEWKKGKNDV